jgi:hypothetical protein
LIRETGTSRGSSVPNDAVFKLIGASSSVAFYQP